MGKAKSFIKGIILGIIIGAVGLFLILLRPLLTMWWKSILRDIRL